MLELSAVEDELSRHGRFNLIDWLLSENYLLYADYEAWRHQYLDTLDECLSFTDAKMDELVKVMEVLAGLLELSPMPVDYYAWNDSKEILHASNSRSLHQGLVTRWQRTEDVPQMDLFMDNSSLIAENELGSALAERDWDAADEALQRLTQANPAHRQLGAYVDLLNYGRHMQETPSLVREALTPELEGLRQEVTPLAKELLGANARDYLAFAWRRMADSMGDIPFDPKQPELHLSYSLEQIPDWQSLEKMLLADDQRYQYPQLMESLIRCYSATAQHAKADVIWCLLFDFFPEQAEPFMELNRDPKLYVLWESFLEFYTDWSDALFASFVLITQPGLLHHLKSIPSLRHQANLATVELLECRRTSRNESAARKKLHGLSPRMMSYYLSRI